MSGLGRIAKGVAGVVVVVIILLTVNAWYSEYRAATARNSRLSSGGSSANSATTTVVPVQGQRVVLLADSVPLSAQPATGTKTVRVLKKGEQLLLVGITSNNWLQLRDVAGKTGYVANISTNVKVQK